MTTRKEVNDLQIEIYLNDTQEEQLMTIYNAVNDPDVATVQEYVNNLFEALLSQMWEGVRKEIMN